MDLGPVTPTAEYSLQELPGGTFLAEYRRRLVRRDAPLPVIVGGDKIVLQLACGDRTLLATSYDYFDGCEHWLYLIGDDGRPVDQLRMPDAFGFFRDIEVMSPDAISFGCFGTNERWSIVVSRTGFWSYAPSVLLKRPVRFLLSKRYLSESRTKESP